MVYWPLSELISSMEDTVGNDVTIFSGAWQVALRQF